MCSCATEGIKVLTKCARDEYGLRMASEMKNHSYKAEPELVKAASEAAKANGENVSVVIRRALIQYVKENQT